MTGEDEILRPEEKAPPEAEGPEQTLQDLLDEESGSAHTEGAEGDGEEGVDAGEAPRGLLREYSETVLVAVLVVIFLQTYLFQQSKIPSSSMEDTLLIGDHILVNNFIFAPGSTAVPILPGREPRRGDVVVFRPPHRPDTDFIKRIVGLPGETLRVRAGTVLIDGRPLAQPHVVLKHPGGTGEREFGPVRVPAGHYFVMGDNRDVSEDSRRFHSIPRECIRGRAVLVWFSLKQPPEPPHRDPRVRFARSLVQIVTFPKRMRWERVFQPIY